MKSTTAILFTLLAALTSAAPLEPQAQNTSAGPSAVLMERRSQTGKMTHYTPGQGSCGKTNTENDLVVAISQSIYGTYANPNASPMCAKSASIKCGGKTITAAVVDKCMSCGKGDIDVSPAVFKQCGALSAGVITVTWDVVSKK
ncbi:hypothetical protein KVR01_006980 [Diaporthe batatas]|uniref:uncharacterized protein n=1 Tax=Diaporthe batatas TaxID=748121 RepID=UPI001D050BE1|nr:uncharacterized protein KVR01_006980 [Diaporthe batatas]KAG8163683.1 hypothetical protein KVR01_006980 [Diaporthe batatas]